MRRIVLILTMALAVTGCRYDVDEILLQREDISLTMKGQTEFVYDAASCQLSHNASTNEYRMYDDKLSEWVSIKCSARPDTEDQVLYADISWTASSSTRSERGLKFTVQKTASDGRVWMWNKSKRIGIVIKNL
ncbi:MAG: hypothetical protein IJE85_05145 [Bacteroidales bacterium]|nr:hypothetical protein [Bacteroidales bacterium]